MCLWFSCFCFEVRCLISCLFFGVGTFLVLEFSFYIPLYGWIGRQILFEFSFVLEYLFSPSMLVQSFAGYSNPDWDLCSLSVCMTSDQALLAFIVSVEKTGVILIGLSLYVTWSFFLAAFNIHSLFCMFSVLIIM